LPSRIFHQGFYFVFFSSFPANWRLPNLFFPFADSPGVFFVFFRQLVVFFPPSSSARRAFFEAVFDVFAPVFSRIVRPLAARFFHESPPHFLVWTALLSLVFFPSGHIVPPCMTGLGRSCPYPGPRPSVDPVFGLFLFFVLSFRRSFRFPPCPPPSFSTWLCNANLALVFYQGSPPFFDLSFV